MKKLLLSTVLLLGSQSLSAQYNNNYYYGGQSQILSNSDASTRQNVQHALDASSNLDTSNINFTVENGRVTLTGTVSTNAQKSAARSAAIKARGVTSVNNRLIVSTK